MKAINPMGVRNKGEYTADSWQPNYGRSTIPSKATAKPSMIDGPYGGKKPVSRG